MRALAPALLASSVLALPAQAQIYGPPSSQPAPAPAIPGIARDVSKIGSVIREGRRSGELSRKQAKELRREAAEISDLEGRYAADGLTDPERAELRTRAEVLRSIANAKRSGMLK